MGYDRIYKIRTTQTGGEAMSRTNLQVLTDTLGWSDGSLDGCENKPLSVPLPTVLNAMSAARTDERERVREIMEKYIDFSLICKSSNKEIKTLKSILEDIKK